MSDMDPVGANGCAGSGAAALQQPVLHRLSSSLRVRPAEETLAQARLLAPRIGISRVTDITCLDRVGIPVCASVRPQARDGSLCVNAGKGLRPIEARVGAYMEAIEYAFAEYGASNVVAFSATARHVLDGCRRPEAILDFCPILGIEIDPNDPLMCVEGEDFDSSGSCLIPAELVFHPSDDALGESYFGTSTNGLASGNTVLEATVHGLAEVVERDIRSFQAIRNTALNISLASLPHSLAAVVTAIRDADLTLVLKYMANDFGLPCFAAVVAEVSTVDPIYVSGGFSCHPSREIAATRAICEALQSRLSFIHGAREDLVNHYARFAEMDAAARAQHAREIIDDFSAAATLEFTDVPDYPEALGSLDRALAVLVRGLESAGIRRICRVTFTSPGDPLQVVRIVVPRLEFFTTGAPRFGVRLRDYVNAT